MMEGDNQPLSERFRLAGIHWAELDAAANLLEDSKSAVLAQKCAELGDIPVNRAEQIIKGGRFWKEYIEALVEARKKANIAKVEMEFMRMKVHEQQSHEANVRAELRSLGGTT